MSKYEKQLMKHILSEKYLGEEQEEKMTKERLLQIIKEEIELLLDEAYTWPEKQSSGELKEKENNPWAICTASVGRKDKEKYEKCVKSVKKKNGGE